MGRPDHPVPCYLGRYRTGSLLIMPSWQYLFRRLYRIGALETGSLLRPIYRDMIIIVHTQISVPREDEICLLLPGDHDATAYPNSNPHCSTRTSLNQGLQNAGAVGETSYVDYFQFAAWTIPSRGSISLLRLFGPGEWLNITFPSPVPKDLRPWMIKLLMRMRSK